MTTQPGGIRFIIRVICENCSDVVVREERFLMNSPLSAHQVQEANLYRPEFGLKPNTTDELQTPNAAITEPDIHPLPSVSGLPSGQTAMEIPKEPPPDWKAGRGEWMIIIVLAIVSLMVALDATILVSALAVSIIHSRSWRVG